jgi:hypothetical protein
LDSYVSGELPKDAFPVLAGEIQDKLGIVGHSSLLPGSLTWSPATHTQESRRLIVSIINREGMTRVRVEERFEIRGFRGFFVAAGGLAGAVFASVIGAFLGVSEAAVPGLLFPFLILGVMGGVFGTVKFEANTRRGELESLCAHLTGLVSTAVSEDEEGKKELGPGSEG